MDSEAQNVYRVFRLGYFLDLLARKRNTLVSPAKWEDPSEQWWTPYYKLLGGIPAQDVFGQCWTRTKESDAMWRIYSSHCDGVKIRTTVGTIEESLTAGDLEWRSLVSPIRYCSVEELRELAVRDIAILREAEPNADPWKAHFELTRLEGWQKGAYKEGIVDGLEPEPAEVRVWTTGIYAMLDYSRKRDSFEWEEEVRLLAWAPDRAGCATFCYSLDPITFIHEVVFDPRMNETICEMVESHIRAEGLECPVYRSELYTPNTVVSSCLNPHHER